MGTRTIIPESEQHKLVATGNTNKIRQTSTRAASSSIQQPTQDPPSVPGQMLECPFNLLGCSKKYDSQESQAWYLHSLEHFGDVEPPQTNRCCFCESTFEATDGNQSWQERMDHISLHQRSGRTLAEANPDIKIYTHLLQHKVIDDLEFRDIIGSIMTTYPPSSWVEPVINHQASELVEQATPENIHIHDSPLFASTVIHQEIKCSDGNSVCPQIDIALGGMFVQTDDNEWSCYRRNLFGVHCSFDFDRSCRHPLCLTTDNDPHPRKIVRFHLSLFAVTDSGDPVKLQKISLPADGNQVHNQETPPSPAAGRPCSSEPHRSTLDSYAVADVARNLRVAEFNRMQFQTATANNGRRKNAQQYHHLLVDLSAETFPNINSPLPIATRMSYPLIVRGRSPRNFTGMNVPENGALVRNEVSETFKEISNPAPSAGLSYTVASQLAKPNDASDARLPPNNHLSKVAVPSSWDLWFYGWCRQGPMNVKLHDCCSNCHRQRDPYAFYGSSDVPPWQTIGASIQPQLSLEPARYDSEHLETGGSPIEASDNSSISSFAFSSKSLLSSRSSVAFHPETDVQFVDLLLEDTGFKALCTDGFSSVDPDRFERNLRRLLKIFLRALRLTSSPQLQELFVRYRHHRAKDIATALRTQFAPNSNEKKQHWENLVTNKVAKEQLLQRYLQDSSIHKASVSTVIDDSWKHQIVQESSKDPESDSSSSDQNSDDQTKPESFALSQSVKEVIFGSDAWEDLREGLVGFLVPILEAKYQARYQKDVARKVSEHDADHGRSPTPDPLLVVISNRLSVLHKAKTHLEDFGQSLQRIKVCLQNQKLSGSCIEQEVPLFAKLGAVEARIGHIYTKCLQERYQQSYEPNSIQETEKDSLRSRGIDSKLRPKSQLLMFNHTISAEFNIDEAKLHRDLIDIEELTQQLPTKRLNDLAASASSDPPLAKKRLIWVERISQRLTVPSACKFRFRISPIGILSTLRYSGVEALSKRWREAGRPCIPSGHQRVEWLCVSGTAFSTTSYRAHNHKDCGETLWADFQIETLESARTLARWLEHHPDQQSNGHPTTYMPASLGAGSAPQLTGQTQNCTTPASQSSSVVRATGNMPTSAATISSNALKERYLELCINTGEHDITLAEIPITTPEISITSDGQLFEEIRKQYNKTRGFLRSHKWSLFKPRRGAFRS
ncbi:MAG: hypothetical protein Q9225_007047, partial [Loekoesia sp. 1 TL-2023]